MLRRKLERLADIYLAGVSVWALAWQLGRDGWGGLALLNAWAFWLISTALPLGVLRLRRRAIWLAGGWLLAGLALLMGRYRFVWRALSAPAKSTRGAEAERNANASLGRTEPAAESSVALRVMSMNLLRKNRRGRQVVDAIRSAAPDLVVTQELEPYLYDFLEQALPDYPYRHWRPHCKSGGGLGVFSRYPLQPTGLWEKPGTRPFGLRVTVDLPGGTLDVYSVHLISIGAAALQKAGLTGNFRSRECQVRILLDEVATRGRAAMLLGDCNMTEGNESYRLFSAELSDAWRAVGRGPGWTWPHNLDVLGNPGKRAQPLLRLDYCFCTVSVRPQQMHVVYTPTGSDHCPIVVDTLVSQSALGRQPAKKGTDGASFSGQAATGTAQNTAAG
jgi:endonuclease/exonuclease/phosphatase (EEP) superfamily protein YafD